MVALSIRNVFHEDLPDLESLFLSCFNAPPWNDGWTREAAHERLGDLLSARHARGAIAFVGREIVGMLLGQKERWVDAYHFNLVEMCVLPNRQRSGIGRALLRHVLDELEREWTGKVYLITAPDGPAAAFYGKQGFYASRGRVLMAKNMSPFRPQGMAE